MVLWSCSSDEALYSSAEATFLTLLATGDVPAMGVTAFACAAVFYIIYELAKNYLAPWIQHYAQKHGLKKRFDTYQHEWAARIVSLFFCSVAFPLGVHICFLDPCIKADRFNSGSPLYFFLLSLAAGYFIFDIVQVSFHESKEFILHGIFSLSTFASSMFIGPHWNAWPVGSALVMELSTIFVHLRWILINTKQTEGWVFTCANYGFGMTFLLCRILFMMYMAPVVLYAFYTGESTAPLWWKGMMTLNVLLSGSLNAYWFYLIVVSITKGRTTVVDAESAEEAIMQENNNNNNNRDKFDDIIHVGNEASGSQQELLAKRRREHV